MGQHTTDEEGAVEVPTLYPDVEDAEGGGADSTAAKTASQKAEVIAKIKAGAAEKNAKAAGKTKKAWKNKKAAWKTKKAAGLVQQFPSGDDPTLEPDEDAEGGGAESMAAKIASQKAEVIAKIKAGTAEKKSKAAGKAKNSWKQKKAGWKTKKAAGLVQQLPSDEDPTLEPDEDAEGTAAEIAAQKAAKIAKIKGLEKDRAAKKATWKKERAEGRAAKKAAWKTKKAAGLVQQFPSGEDPTLEPDEDAEVGGDESMAAKIASQKAEVIAKIKASKAEKIAAKKSWKQKKADWKAKKAAGLEQK